MPEPSRSIRCATVRPSGPATSRARRYSRRSGFFFMTKPAGTRNARLRPAAAAERHQQRAGKAQEADHGGDRIARQTDEHRAARRPKASGRPA